ALYLAGSSNGSNIRAVGIFRVDDFWMDNDTLNSMDQLKHAVIGAAYRLCSLAPAAIENGVGCRNACRGRRILTSHDFNENGDRSSGMAPRQRAD
ncbi:MAG: hypothetical protein ACREDP_12585, partial [Bradyrhizobium sp.]